MTVPSDPATRAITVSHFDIFPKPIAVPGNVTTAYDITIHRNIEKNSHLQFNVTWDKKLLGHYHKIPCKNGLGTCVYDDPDPCALVDQLISIIGCPQEVIDRGTTCGCPVNPVHLVMNYRRQGYTISPLKPVSISAPSWLYGLESPIWPMIKVLSGKFEFKEIPHYYSFLGTGDYRLRIELLESNKMIGCLAVQFQFRLPCTGFLCGK